MMTQAVPNFQSFQQGFVAFRITSTSPLTVEYYANVYAADAELDVTTLWPCVPLSVKAPGMCWQSPTWPKPPVELAYSDDKATAKKIEWTNFVGGPSLDILSKYLDQAIATEVNPIRSHPGQVHYAPMMPWLPIPT